MYVCYVMYCAVGGDSASHQLQYVCDRAEDDVDAVCGVPSSGSGTTQNQ